MVLRADARVSRLLLDEPPIPISRTLAAIVGLEEATLLQQMHFRCVCAQSDRANRWVVQEQDGSQWVAWSQAGLLEDIPLGDSLAPHRRALSKLRALKVVLVQQLEKSRWNRANFYRIDHSALNALLNARLQRNEVNRRHDTTLSGGRVLDFDGIESNDMYESMHAPDVAQEESKEENKEESREAEEERRAPLNLSLNLKSRLQAMIGRRPGDNQLWDRKRLTSILATVASHSIESCVVEDILENTSIRYLSQVEKRLEQHVRDRNAEQQSTSERAAVARQVDLVAQQAAALREGERRAQQYLDCVDEARLAALCEQIAARVPVPSLRKTARSTVAARQLGVGVVRAVIITALGEYPLPESSHRVAQCNAISHVIGNDPASLCIKASSQEIGISAR